MAWCRLGAQCQVQGGVIPLQIEDHARRRNSLAEIMQGGVIPFQIEDHASRRNSLAKFFFEAGNLISGCPPPVAWKEPGEVDFRVPPRGLGKARGH